MDISDPSISLSAVLACLPRDLARMVGTPSSIDRYAHGVFIADPAGPAAGPRRGDIVLGVGFAGERADDLIASTARAGAAAVVLRIGGAAARMTLTASAAAAGTVLLELQPARSWGELHTALTDALGPGRSAVTDPGLSGLAETIAALAGGAVTIEDAQARVLAYSTSTDEVDELRRLSILGRSGPPSYLALLRDWGIYDRLAAGDVIAIDEDAASGIQPRLAVGLIADDRYLGTIWVQQGAEQFRTSARQALLGAAQVVAAELMSERQRGAPRVTEGLSELLAGSAETLPGLGARLLERPCRVAAVDLADDVPDRAGRRLRLQTLATMSRVHAAALRKHALVTELDGRIYVLLPDLVAAEEAVPMLELTLADAQRRGAGHACAALGPMVESVSMALQSRLGADRALFVGADGVTVFDSVRSRLFALSAVRAAAGLTDLADPRLAALLASNPDLAGTLLCYLDRGCDVRAAADELAVHQTTVRYRLRRAESLLELDLADSDTRLATQLQLRAWHSPGDAKPPGPAAVAATTTDDTTA